VGHPFQCQILYRDIHGITLLLQGLYLKNKSNKDK
jgi:hypothetical protein